MTDLHASNINEVSLISTLAVPTLKDYLYSLSMYQEGKAFITPFPVDTSALKISDGKLYDQEGREIPPMEVEATKEDIKKLDIPLLLIMHTAWWSIYEHSGFATPPSQIKLYIPELIRNMGVMAKQNKLNRDVVLNKIIAFHKSIGCVREVDLDKTYEKRFPVLVFREFDERENTVIIESPYMEYVIQKMHEYSMDKRAKGQGTTRVTKKAEQRPTHSYIVKASIACERNKRAVENVINIVSLIERAGNNEAHIKASTLVERNPLLKKTLNDTSKTGNKNVVLKRDFIKTWELLKTKTLLFEKYKNLEIPDIIPIYQTLSTTVLTFRHDGKKMLSNSEKDADRNDGADSETVGEL